MNGPIPVPGMGRPAPAFADLPPAEGSDPGPPPPPPSPPSHGPDPSDERYSPGEPPAWEGEGPWLDRLWRTTRQVLARPAATLAATPRPEFKPALTYGVIMGTFGVSANIIWGMLLDGGPHPWGEHARLILLLLSPLTTALGIVVLSGLLHLALKVAGGARRVFFATYRVVGYSYAASVFYLVPVVGVWIAMVWDLVVVVNGLAASHGVGRWRVAVALLMVIVLIGLTITLAGFLMIPASGPAPA